jgi:uncharacterized protein YndB with AHSA1/START domain
MTSTVTITGLRRRDGSEPVVAESIQQAYCVAAVRHRFPRRCTYSGAMGVESFGFERDYEFPPIIVWDALIDADLVSGWLAEATITPEVGGQYNLLWLHRVGQPMSPGRIAVLHPLERLDVETASFGRMRFELEELEGGNRGTSTRLRLTVELEIEPVFSARLKADWLTTLDQLDGLLRGHPVDWASWESQMQETWAQHLGEVENSTA